MNTITMQSNEVGHGGVYAVESDLRSIVEGLTITLIAGLHIRRERHRREWPRSSNTSRCVIS